MAAAETDAAGAHRTPALARLVEGHLPELSYKPAIVCGERVISYSQLESRASKLASAIAEMESESEIRIATLGKNSGLFYELLIGTAKAGACFLPINFRLAPAEIAYIIDDAAPALLFVSDEMCGPAEAALALATVKPRLIRIGTDADPHEEFTQFAASGTGAPAVEPRPEQDVLQLYTSGTTGRPKGGRLSNRNLSKVWELSSEVCGFDYARDDVVLTVMPQFHVAGINSGLITLFHGGTVVVVPDFEPGNIFALIERHRCTQAFLVPAMIIMLLDAYRGEGFDISSLRQIAYGGSAITGALLERARATLACKFSQLYGMTESTGAGTVLAPHEHDLPGKAGSCGRAWPGLEIKIVDEALNELPPRAKGQLVICGETIMSGYWKQEEAFRETVREVGLLTGDGGYMDEDGFVFIEDRIKDMVISGGENIAPTEVENAIAGCPGVKDVAVIGVPSERWGEEVKAVVVADPETPADPAAIITWARGRIASYKVPKSVDFADSIPRNASGKILRRELRERYGPKA